MSRTILAAGTIVLVAAAAILWWIAEQLISAIYAGTPAWGLCLFLAAGVAICALFLLISAIANVVDLVDVTFGGPRPVRQ